MCLTVYLSAVFEFFFYFTPRFMLASLRACVRACVHDDVRKRDSSIDNSVFLGYRAGAGANGIFNRRLDFSSFNSLPRNKLNSYHIKVRPLTARHGTARSLLVPPLRKTIESKKLIPLLSPLAFLGIV